MLLVVDASVAVKWLVEEEHSDEADRLLDGNHELFAPRLMASEVGNALWRKVRMGELERSRAGALAAAISREVLSDPNVSVKLADTKAASEVKALDSFYSMLQNEPNRAFYG